MIRRFLLVVAVLALMLSYTACGSSAEKKTEYSVTPSGKANIEGTYVSKNVPSLYIEIRENGTFSFCDMRDEIYYGSWHASDGNITFRVPTGVYFSAEVRADTLYLDRGFNGQTVFKKGKPELSP